MFIQAYSLIINKINRSLYIIWLLEEITNNSNKYCIFGLTFQSPLSEKKTYATIGNILVKSIIQLKQYKSD